MDDDKDVHLACLNGGHSGSIYSANQAGALEAFERVMREGRKINAGDTSHQVIIGKACDGMSSLAKSTASPSGTGGATGLLAGLMRRI